MWQRRYLNKRRILLITILKKRQNRSIKAQQHTIFSQLRKKLYLWNKQLASEVQQQKRQYFETWLTEHPDQVNRLVYEISKLLIEDELKILLSNQVAGKKHRQAKQFWENLIQYLGTHDNSPILSQIILARLANLPAGQRYVLLIDEVDDFIRTEAQRQYTTLHAFRNLSAEGRCHFILAGFGTSIKPC